MQQHEDPVEKQKRNFNAAFNIAVIYQLALVIPLRNRFGVEALRPCLFSFIMLIGWSAFSGDTYMWWFTGAWLLCFCARRVQSLKMQDRIHSRYDGWPLDAMRICKDENKAKLVVEPVIVGFAGAFCFWLYQQNGWNVRGLPYFLICGSVLMVFVEMARQQAWKRRIRGMNDARIEQEQMVREMQDKWGDS